MTATLVICVLGLYGSFLTWSVLQERINTKPYGEYEPEFFKAPLVVNLIQALMASVVGYIYATFSGKVRPFDVFTKNDRQIAQSFFKWFILIAITSSLSSPIAYLSLIHVDYVAFLLAKSCKLIPVMLVHVIFYRTKFPLFKYLVAGSVTLGVLVFTLSQQKVSKQDRSDGNTLLGVVPLLFSMFLDGLTNSTQDQLFKIQSKEGFRGVKITGPVLMCLLNILILILTASYILIFEYNSEVVYTVNFVKKYPTALVNILEFTALGAIGQVFVFVILENFGSLVLVVATVTRKMISMIISVFLFGHQLSPIQWVGVALVFGGIAYEALVKVEKKKVHKE